MPIYEYQCENCSCRFELKQSFSDDSIVTCPQCMRNARRIFLPAPIIFKGSGFYITDVKQSKDKTNKYDVKKGVAKD
ncbi:FmdB family zinc ribbon protein [Chloroflexota bacterium]